MLPLTELSTHATAKLSQLGGDRSFQRRLMELGLLPGTSLRVVRRVPMGGLLEIEVRRSRVTLRMTEAAQVLVAQD
ncbi:MAG: ferrous iron transport protein A [Planctomycetota bacterium]|jgi:ferrous iron transport protein A